MAIITYIEDIFLNFAHAVDMRNIAVQPQDIPAITSFQNAILESRPFTRAQSSFVLRILQKYKTGAKMWGIDYSDALDDPQWKTSFRVLDNSRKVSMDADMENLTILMKFPYALKDAFEKTFPGVKSQWDADALVRKIKLSDINIIALQEFCNNHSFAVDDIFTYVCNNIEEIWNQEDEFVPYAIAVNNEINLVNACPDAQEYFNQHKTSVLEQDMFLAKSMNFILKTEKKELSLMEKITTSTDNYFYTADVDNAFKLINMLPDPQNVAVIVDRTSDKFDFIKQFVAAAEKTNFPKKDIRVCFRLTAEEDRDIHFNQWIKDNELNGPINNGKVFIFSHKPAKWLFTNKQEVKIIITNSLFTNTNVGTNDWMRSHPCVLYVGATKPALRGLSTKEKKIVNL
jgi:hypothetical protein